MFKREIRTYDHLIFDSLFLYKRTFGSVLKILLIVIVPQLFFTIAGSFVYFGWLDIVFGINFGILILLLVLAASIGVSYVFYADIKKQKLSMKDVFGNLLQRYLPYLGLSFVIYIILGTLVPFGFLVFTYSVIKLISLLYYSVLLEQALSVAMVIVALIFIIYILIRFSLSPYFLLFHGDTVLSSLRKSSNLVSGHFSHVASHLIAVGLLFILITTIVSVALTLLISLIAGNLHTILIILTTNEGPWWSFVIWGISATLSIPLFIAVSLHIYDDLVGLKGIH